MELIRNLPMRLEKNGHWQSWAIFWCDFCKQEVEKRLGSGINCKSCGCQRYKLSAESNTGKKRTEKIIFKISESLKGKPSWNKGKSWDIRIKQKISNSNKGRKAWNKGKNHSEEIKQKIRETKIKNGSSKGENNPNWQGGISFEIYPQEFNKELKQSILKRDSYICQNPNCEYRSNRLHVHHIDYDKKNNIQENHITLCNSCHIKTNFNRQYWTEFYQNIMINRIAECLL